MSKPPIFDVEALYVRVDAERRRNNLRWAQVAQEAGVVASTFSRMGIQHLMPNGDNLARILVWLGDTDIAQYIRTSEEEA